MNEFLFAGIRQNGILLEKLLIFAPKGLVIPIQLSSCKDFPKLNTKDNTEGKTICRNSTTCT